VIQHLLLTGKPGVGKTTLIERLIDRLRRHRPHIRMTGFITKEVRSQGSRIGFDIHTLDGQLGVLARVQPQGKGKKYLLGKYFVNLQDLETIGIPSLRKDADLIFLDEIGKMELFSEVFKDTINALFDGKKKIVATIAWYDTSLIKKIKLRPNVQLIEVTRQNRNAILKNLIDQIDS
jgi:nucleoside-triphosphatase